MSSENQEHPGSKFREPPPNTSAFKSRQAQLERDNGRTFGHISKDPCFMERQQSMNCIQTLSNSAEDKSPCSQFFLNFKKCKEFWNAVTEYRVRNMRKRRSDHLSNEEYAKWKSQLPEWIETSRLNPPDDL